MSSKLRPTLIWPTGLRLSNITVPKRDGRVALETAWLRPTEEDNKWTLQATNAYCFARVPVTIDNEAKLRERVVEDQAIPLPPKALAALEAGPVVGAAYFDDDGSVTVDDVTYHPPNYWAPAEDGLPATPGQFPDMAKLEPVQEKQSVFEIGFDADILIRLARAMGSKQVRVEFDTATTLRAFYVYPLGAGRDQAKGMLMPIRLNV